jgi:type IV pilus assembly protein PilW
MNHRPYSRFTAGCPQFSFALGQYHRRPSICPSNSKRQAGVSLIELLVAMTIGLIISAGAAALFANTILSTKTLNSASQIQEAGASLSQNLARQLRMAGYVDWIENGTTLDKLQTTAENVSRYNNRTNSDATMFSTRVAPDTYLALHGCASTYSTPTTLTSNDCGADSNTAHSFTVAYQVVSDFNGSNDEARALGAISLNPVFANARGMSGDCNNQKTAPAVYAVNRYYIGANNQLYCMGNGGLTQPIASNVEQLVVTYALAQLNPSTTAKFSADELVGDYQTAAAISAANAWGKVISARLCVLIAGEVGSLAKASSTATAARNDCNVATPAKINIADGRLRQTFVTTVALRNQIHSANTPN